MNVRVRMWTPVAPFWSGDVAYAVGAWYEGAPPTFAGPPLIRFADFDRIVLDSKSVTVEMSCGNCANAQQMWPARIPVYCSVCRAEFSPRWLARDASGIVA